MSADPIYRYRRIRRDRATIEQAARARGYRARRVLGIDIENAEDRRIWAEAVTEVAEGQFPEIEAHALSVIQARIARREVLLSDTVFSEAAQQWVRVDEAPELADAVARRPVPTREPVDVVGTARHIKMGILLIALGVIALKAACD